MNKLNHPNQSPEHSKNHESEKNSILSSTKNSLKKLLSAVIVAWVLQWNALSHEITISSYDQLQKITSKMKEQDTITVQVKSWNIDNFIKKLEDNGFDVKKWKNWKLVITKKQKEEDWGEWNFMKKVIKETHKETKTKAEQSKKEAEQSKRKAEQAKRKAEQAEMELALTNYEENFATILLNTLEEVKKWSITKEKLIDNLKKMKKDVNAWNIVSSKYNRKTRLDGLDTIKVFYPKNKTILNLIDQIEKKLKSYPVNYRIQ